ncbi:MAG: type II secretion system protein [Sideroxydans sp.]|nr:type II secretion system protein [Sideroxydans sp.]
MQHKQSGFTLIEISIAMAVIGLLITLTIKGREMVENSRAKSLANDFRDIQVALFGYQDRFHALPGDDPAASANLSTGSTPIHNGNGNLRIEGNLNPLMSESFFLWQHVRLAGFLSGTIDPGANNYVPLNSSGGKLGVSDISASPIKGMSGGYIICSDNISGRLVKQLDMMLDDGNTAGGAMRVSHANDGGEPLPTSNIIESDFYLACLST